MWLRLCQGSPFFSESLLALALPFGDYSSLLPGSDKSVGLQLSEQHVPCRPMACQNHTDWLHLANGQAMKNYKQIWRQRLAKLMLASTVSGLIAGGEEKQYAYACQLQTSQASLTIRVRKLRFQTRLGHLLFQHGLLLPLPGCSYVQQRCAFAVC